MAYFARQKRQSRFYWAELGFMALGLLGLQPSLFTNLLASAQSRTNSYAYAHYPTQQGQVSRGYENLPSHQFAWYLPAYSTIPSNPSNGWQPVNPQYPYAQQQLYSAPPQQYVTTQPYSSAQPYSSSQPYVATSPYAATYPTIANQPNGGSPAYSAFQQPNNTPLTPYLQNSYSQPFLTSNNGTSNFPTQQFYSASPSYAQHHDFQPARPSYPNGSQNSVNYLAQAASSNNGSVSQPNTYYSQPQTNLNSASYPYNAIAPRLTQNQLFENGASSNYNGSTSAQNYLNQTNAGNSSSFQRYRAPSPLYR